MKAYEEVREKDEVNEAKEHERNIAAFFDLDGTLMALPSLERRFFRILRYRREIPAKNCFLWLREALRLLPRGINAVLQANKMYLRGVHILDECGERDSDVSSSDKTRRNPRLPVPAFFAQAIQRVAWHARQGHEIVLVSGTLEPLAREAARAMEAQLAERGITATIHLIATRLEQMGGRWTGRISGEAMFGEAKARTAKLLAEEMQLALEQCYAYGDSLNDQWLMDAVGRPAAVNRSKDLLSVARTKRWPVLHWDGKENRSHDEKGLKLRRQFAMKLAKLENPE